MDSYVDVEQWPGAWVLSQIPQVLIMANGGWTFFFTSPCNCCSNALLIFIQVNCESKALVSSKDNRKEK